MGYFQTDKFEHGLDYHVQYEFELKGDSGKPYFVKAFLPTSDNHQILNNVKNEFKVGDFKDNVLGENNQGYWRGNAIGGKQRIQYAFNVKVKPESFNVPDDLSYEEIVKEKSEFLKSTEFIESEDPRIIALGKELKENNKTADAVITEIFGFVYDIPSQPIKELMTATEALEKNAASCNGKSRLFVALCRSLGIPARVTGGIILNEEEKKTSHLWAEVLIKGQWVPFDALNGYYAFLPANYLKIYSGDHFLVTRSADMLFDYQYSIQSIEDDLSLMASFNLFHIARKTELPVTVLAMMLLLPLGALVVAIFRNVIGVKTFGVFLPVLIALSFTSTGLLFGIISFVGVLIVISFLHYPLMKWGVLHVPKLVVMLSAVVFLMVLLLFTGVQLNLSTIGSLTFFPIVILTITAEKYARIVVEEGVIDASKVLLQTLMVTLFCYVLVSSDMIFVLLMNFPELLLIVVGASILLGKWIGLRIAEYKRFGWVIS